MYTEAPYFFCVSFTTSPLFIIMIVLVQDCTMVLITSTAGGVSKPPPAPN
jgi:hypothetical protein